jgi:Tol biopolymer transport system component
MKKISMLIAILILLAFGVGNLAAQNGYDLFQKALAKERAEGNLEEAIALYQKVIAESKDESLAAKAQLRIGICYEKLGQEKAKLAQEAFQKVVDNYPGQVETVKVAREKLSGLLRIQTLVEKDVIGMSIRHLLNPLKGGEEVGFGRVVSPDGRYLAYFDYNAGAAAVYELATGKKRILKSKVKEDEPSGESWSFIWSADSKSLLCNWWQHPEFHWVDLRLLRNDGNEQRTLFSSDKYEDVYPMDWSSDGKLILAAFYGGHSEGKKIGLVSVEDGSERILKTVDPKWGYMEFSPDARYVAYDFCPEKQYSRHDISILSIDGKVENPLVTHPAHDSLVGWSPDGKYVLFASDRTGTNDLWLIPVEDGKPDGPAELVKKGLGEIDVLGLTQDGSLYYICKEQMEDIYVAEMDQATGKVDKAPQKMIFSQEGSNSWPQYSPDGKSIVCVQGGGIMAERAETQLCVRSLETGEERQFPLRMQARHPRWSPDARFIYFTATDRPGHLGIYRIELKTGQVSRAWPEDPESKPIGDIFVGISPDGKNYYYVHSKLEGRFSQLINREIKTGIEKELFRREKPLYLVASLSPDGKWLAVVSREEERGIQVLPSEGGEPRDVYKFNLEGGHPTWLDWTPDNKSIIFTKRIDESKSGISGWGLYRVSADGGDPQFLGISTTYISDIDVHPDGKHLTFCSFGPEWKKAELWVMENFLPETEKK